MINDKSGFWTELDKSLIPHKPGVYIYKNSKGAIIYVGKAIDLYHRVASYFSGIQFDGVNLSHPRGGIPIHRGGIPIHRQDNKISTLVENIAAVETIIVESELEALILEANLIKNYHPPYNIRLTDDKDYLYICITKEVFPKIISARKKDLTGKKKYWGPFPSSRTVRDTLKSLRKVFPWCSQPPQVISLRSRSLKIHPCFYYHLGLCPGPCAGIISKQEYNKIINQFSKFMDGKKDQLLSELDVEMKYASEKQHFEHAAGIKKTLEGILYLAQTNRTKLYLENPNFLQDENKLALEQLKKDLGLDKLPDRIEGYDISNIQGKNAVGSLVVLTDGEIDKKWYRRFKITVDCKPNDVLMMREIISRRLKHQEWPKPDLILVDGGKPQVGGVIKELNLKGWQVPVFGLAKKREWLICANYAVVKLPRASLALKILQKIRDEAHRFAILYHRKLRTASFVV